ncbi:calcium-dependent phosphotriesterase superfamily protein [Artemisia annua]|uniref:Calcium-dependent phosphotriesterase superfamily protein n=1 Tax=Artemisia annua TaxID=35608 RepID=A0A2U1MTE8_ARTAN|nr:calcium-dependent phosphotriesterase superfamily protein [Artemisia annua]
MASFFCSTKFFFLLFLISAIPIAIIVSLESTTPTTNYYQFHSTGWFRESSKWDDVNNRFIVSFTDSGGLGVVNVPKDHKSSDILEEVLVVGKDDLYGNGTCGVFIDRPRNRAVVAIADVFGNKYSAVAAYDLTSWERLFYTQLSVPGGGKSFADDVTVDAEGNAYVTDAKGTQIWKVSVDGQLLTTIKSPLFHAKEWYNDIITLNGIVYHPNGYIIVAHTITGKLFKVEINNDNKVTEVKLEGKLKIADGLELLSPTKLVVAGANGVKLVESNDDWITASLIGRSPVLTHRVATAAMVKDGKVYINHALGMGFPKKKHVFVEAAFS